MNANCERPDLRAISNLIKPSTRVLDVGCGDGSLLEILREQRNVQCSGIELSQEGVNDCVRKGLSVIQGDADRDLDSYISGVFDYVIMSHAILSVQEPKRVLERITSVGREAVVSIYNFSYWKDRLSFCLWGRIQPKSPFAITWDRSQTMRRCSITDFRELCELLNLKVKQSVVLNENGRPLKWKFLHNLLGRQAVFVLACRDGRNQ